MNKRSEKEQQALVSLVSVCLGGAGTSRVAVSEAGSVNSSSRSSSLAAWW